MNSVTNLRTILVNKRDIKGINLDINNQEMFIVEHENKYYSITRSAGAVNINPIIGLIYNVNLNKLPDSYVNDLKQETENLYSDYYKEFIVQ
jgi:hypothetical protein